MTLKRLMILLGILVVLAGIGIAWLWQCAYSPQGRARVIIAQLKDDTTSLRGWMLQHHVIRPGFSEPPLNSSSAAPEDWELANHRQVLAIDEMVKLGRGVMPIVIEALRDEDWNVRFMAIKACGKFRDPAAIEPLANCLFDTDSGCEPQDWCLDSLILIGDRKAIPVFLKVIKDEHLGDDLRLGAAVALAQMGQNEGLQYVLAMLKSPPGSAHRADAVDVLARTPVQGTLEALLSLLQRDSDWTVLRRGTVKALGTLRDPRAIPAIKKLLDDEIDPYVREAAADALQELGAKPPPASQPVKP